MVDDAIPTTFLSDVSAPSNPETAEQRESVIKPLTVIPTQHASSLALTQLASNRVL